MWNLQASSKLVSQRSKKKSYDIHREKLKKIQSKIKIKNPVQPDFVYTKNKLNMSRRDRRVQIDQHNQILLRKITQIKMADYSTNKLRPEAQNLKTLNAHVMNTVNKQITEENKRICMKLMRTNSFYPASSTLDKTDHLKYLGQNISYNARRSSQKDLRSSRPYTSHTNLSISKTRNSSYKLISRFDPKQNDNHFPERPETAPMFTRSQKIIVPRSGRPRIQNAENLEQSEAVQML